MMKKKLDLLFTIVIPTIAGYAAFFLLFYFYQKLFFGYRWLAIIPFIIITAFFIRDNIKKWKMINQ